jgi:hypothetical protein
MDMKPIKPEDWSVEYYFTQQYPSMNPYYNTNTALERELDLLDTIDLIVDTMDTYPDAQRLLENLK